MDSKQFVSAFGQSLKALESLQARKISNLLAHKSFNQLATSWCDPRDFSDANAYVESATVTDLLRKAEFLPGLDDEGREAATFDNWLASEQTCARTNARWWKFLPDNSNWISASNVEYQFIDAVRKELSLILGRCPALGDPLMTNGATSSDKTGYTTYPDKLSSEPVCYNKAYQHIAENLRSNSWGRMIGYKYGSCDHIEAITLRDYNEYFTVPKSALIKRACCKEANLMIAYQRCIGVSIARRLKLFGCDIPTGQERHQALAKHASIFGDLATLDMSSASDTIAYNFVKAVVPPSWFEILDALRAQKTRVGTRTFVLEKFSSMGNGYTFELETVLFLAIGRVAAKLSGVQPDVSCYGDDLIVPSASARLTKMFLSYCGFKLNLRKSFEDGPFRESCGGDYFRGEPVNTVKIDTIDNTIPGLFSLYNQLQRIKVPALRDSMCSLVLSFIPLPFRTFGGPAHLGDAVLHGLPPVKRKRDKYGSTMIKSLGVDFYELHYTRWCVETQLLTCSWVKYPITTATRKTYDSTAEERCDCMRDGNSYVYAKWIHEEVNSSWLPGPHVQRKLHLIS